MSASDRSRNERCRVPAPGGLSTSFFAAFVNPPGIRVPAGSQLSQIATRKRASDSVGGRHDRHAHSDFPRHSPQLGVGAANTRRRLWRIGVRKRILVAAVVLTLCCLAAWQQLRPRSTTPTSPLPFSAFLRAVASDPGAFKPEPLQIAVGAGHQAEVRGRWKKDDAAFVTVGYLDEALLARLSRANLG